MNKDMSNGPAGPIADAPDGTPRPTGEVLALQLVALGNRHWKVGRSDDANTCFDSAARIRELEAERDNLQDALHDAEHNLEDQIEKGVTAKLDDLSNEVAEGSLEGALHTPLSPKEEK